MVLSFRQYNLPRKRSFFQLRFLIFQWEADYPTSWISGNWLLQTSEFFQYCGWRGGLWVQFQSRPPLSSVPLNMPVTRDPDRNLLLQEEVHTLFAERCSRLSEPSSYSRFLFPTFSCTKEKWENETCDRPLRPESASNRSIRGSIHLGTWTTSVDLTDTDLHIPISPKFRKFQRFVWEDRVYASKTMPFGLSTAPLVFIRIF